MGAASQHTMLVASSTLLLPTVFPAPKHTVEDASSTCGHYGRWCPSCSQCGFHILLEDACWSAILAGKRRPMTLILTFFDTFSVEAGRIFLAIVFYDHQIYNTMSTYEACSIVFSFFYSGLRLANKICFKFKV